MAGILPDYDSDQPSTSGVEEEQMRTTSLAGQDDSTSQDSYFVASDSESEDSARKRKRAADEALRDSEEVTGPGPLSLPPPLAVIGSTKQPDFLKPEATKQLARPFHRNRAPLTKTVAPAPAQSKEWDIASMAPKLKAQDGERKGPPGVISATAKRYKPDDEGTGVVTAAQVAMLGGQWQPSTSEKPSAQEPSSGKLKLKSDRTNAMGVSEFLAQGEGATMLPRKKQATKMQEKEKRVRGQSSVHGWKSEAEMVLRQQYD